MNPRYTKLFAVSCGILIAFSMLVPMASVLGSSNEGRQIVLVETRDSDEKGKLDDLGLEIIDTYGTFNLVEVERSGIEEIEKKGLCVNKLPSRTEVSVKGHRFDVFEDEPALDSDLMIDEYPEGSEGTYIVHLLGPVNPEWREKLEDKGVEVLNYVPNYAYEVRMTPEKREEVEGLDFVDWTDIYHPGYKIAEDIEPGRLRIKTVPEPDFECLENILSVDPGAVFVETDSGLETTVEIDDLDTVHEIARMKDVYYISSQQELELFSEIESQIIGGGAWIMDDDDDPETAYREYGDHGAYINQLGYTGKGVVVASADTGLGNGSVGDAGHEDFTGRVVGGHSFGSGGWEDLDGHGTHTAGSIAGDTYNGTRVKYAGMDGEYYPGQGLASDSELYSVKIQDENGNSLLPSDTQDVIEVAKQNADAYVHSNSWGETDSQGAYVDHDEAYDRSVRDADRDASGNQPMVITVAAGNNGPDTNTIASPANAKNVVSVGGTATYNSEASNYGGQSMFNPDWIRDGSSRGWTDDNRVKPDVVAPGYDILSTMSPEVSGNYTEDDRYGWMKGTSMANSAVAGAASVIVEWYEDNYGERPSPAMVKALMVNTAEPLKMDQSGNGLIDHIPNKHEGWGMVDISKLEYPKDDPIDFMLEDQESLVGTGEVDEYEVHRERKGAPLNISLTWTDEEASAGDNPTLKNDLDLEVEAPNGSVYRGNSFNESWTKPGTDAVGDFDSSGDGWDDTNNVENVYIPSDEVEMGAYTVRVRGSDITSDANNDGNISQDYALVGYNAFLSPDGEDPNIDITRPQAGEDWDALTYENITWDTEAGEDSPDKVDLLLSEDGGKSWRVIADELDDMGVYNWTVPNIHSQECMIKARVIDDVGRVDLNITGKFGIEGVPPAMPYSPGVDHFGPQGELVDNGVFKDKIDPWELQVVEGDANNSWRDTKEYFNSGGSIYSIASQEGDDSQEGDETTTQEAYWEQDIMPVGTEVKVNGAYYMEQKIEENCKIHDSTVKISVHDTDEGWQTIYSAVDPVYGWTEFGPNATYDPTGAVDKVRASMRGEAEGASQTFPPEDYTGRIEMWMDAISVTPVNESDEHNRLTWGPSIDDPENITHYNIYRSQNEDGPWDDPIGTVEAEGSISYEYLDLHKGDVDNTYWWYLVRAVGTNGLEETNTRSIREPVPGTPPTISITSPDGGETWLSGREKEISWTTTEGDDPVDKVDLWYSIDGGEEWREIERGVPDTGNYTWTVPNEPSNISLIRARAWDASERISEYAKSDGYFEIINSSKVEDPTIDVTAPAENALIGESDVTVEWISNHIEYHEVRIDDGDWIEVGEDRSYTFQVEDGEHTVECKAIGEVGLQATDSISFTVDTTSPEIEINAPVEGKLFGTDKVTIEWSGDDERSGIDHYEVRLDGGAWSEVGTETYLTFEDLEDGNHSAEVQANDEANNSASDTTSFTIDTTSPQIQITGPTEGAMFNQESVNIEWERSDNTTSIKYQEIRLDGKIIEENLGPDELQYEIHGLEDGEHEVEITAGDDLDNEDADSVGFLVDTQEPEVDITSFEGDGIFAEDQVTIEWSSTPKGTDIERYEVKLDQGSWQSADRETNHTFEGLEDGEHSVEVRVTDEVGNDAIDNITFTVDTASPTVEIVSPGEGVIVTTESLNVMWAGEKEGTEISRYEIRLDSGEWIDNGKATEYRITEIEQGENSVEVRATDEAGNQATDVVNFTVDTEPPSLEIEGPEEEKTFEENTVTVEWDADPEGTDLDHFEVRLDDGEWVNVGKNTSHTFEDLDDGEYTVEIRSTDIAGNTATESRTFTVDTPVIGFSGGQLLKPMPLLALVLVVVVVVIGVMWKRRKKDEEEPSTVPPVMEKTGEKSEFSLEDEIEEKKKLEKSTKKKKVKKKVKKKKEPEETEEDMVEEETTEEDREDKKEGKSDWMDEETKEAASMEEDLEEKVTMLLEEGPKEEGLEPEEKEEKEEKEEDSLLNCPVCGRELSEDAEKCWACGKDLTEVDDEED